MNTIFFHYGFANKFIKIVYAIYKMRLIRFFSKGVVRCKL